MAAQTIIGVDLAKDVIQVCITHKNHVISNKELTYIQFSDWLATTEPSTIVFEACGTSNYWKQQALSYGHTALLISAKLVESIRQNQKQTAMTRLLLFKQHNCQIPSLFQAKHKGSNSFNLCSDCVS